MFGPRTELDITHYQLDPDRLMTLYRTYIHIVSSPGKETSQKKKYLMIDFFPLFFHPYQLDSASSVFCPQRRSCRVTWVVDTSVPSLLFLAHISPSYLFPSFSLPDTQPPSSPAELIPIPSTQHVTLLLLQQHRRILQLIPTPTLLRVFCSSVGVIPSRAATNTEFSAHIRCVHKAVSA